MDILGPPSKNTGLNRVSIEILIEYINKNFNKLQPQELIITDNEINEQEIISSSNFESVFKSSNSPISFCPKFTKDISYFKTNSDLEVLNINYLLQNIFDIKSSEKSSPTNNFKSLLISILYCITDEKKITSSLVESFITGINKYILIADLKKLNITKIRINRSLKNNIIDNQVLRIISEYLHINLFIFNTKNTKESYEFEDFSYCGGNFIPFKKNIILFNYNNLYYPIITKTNKFFNFDSPILKYCLSDGITLIKTINCNGINLELEDLATYIDIELLPEITVVNQIDDTQSVINGFDDQYSPTEKHFSDNSDDSSSDDEDKVVTVKSVKSVLNFKKNLLSGVKKDCSELEEKYMKYSLKELHQLSKDSNINIKYDNGKLKTKNDLIKDLIN